MYRFLSLPASILLTSSTLLFSHQLIAENTTANAPPPPMLSSGVQPPPPPAMGLRFAPPPMPPMPAAPVPQFFQPAPPNLNQAPPRFQPMPGQNFNPDMFRRSMAAELERAKQLTQPAAPAMPSAELGEMRGQLSKLVSQQEQLMSMLQSQNQQRASLQANHQAQAKQTTEKIQQLEVELAAAKDKNSGMATSLSDASQQIAEMESLKLKLLELEKSSVDSQALQTKLTEAQQALQTTTQKAETVQTELEQMKQSSETSGTQLLSLQQKMSGNETRFTELQSAFDAAKLQLANGQIAAEANTDLQSKLDTASKEVETKAIALTAAEEKITTFEASTEKYKLLEQQAADAKTQLEENQTEITGLKEQIASLKTAAEAAEKSQAAEKLKNTDTDEDGISDAIDECPNTTPKAKVNDKGCEPDTDSDGLVDRVDLCPNTPPGKEIDSAGCHADATIALEGVNFQLGTAQLTDSSLSILDNMVDTLKKFSELSLQVAGHTDDNGSPARNHTLSAQRAETVKSYLIKQGIEATRLEAKGYGSSEPIASNETEPGQAANRRVELRRR